MVKRWGNSYGIVLPKGLVKDNGIVENDTVEVMVRKVADLSSLFGRLRTGRNTQSIKDDMRDGWDG